MIIGIGSDLCNIERIQKSLDRWGDKFTQRVFTDVERAKAERRPFTQAGTYANLIFGTPLAVAGKSSASAPDGDTISNDFRITVPAVRPDTYSGTLNYIVTTL